MDADLSVGSEEEKLVRVVGDYIRLDEIIGVVWRCLLSVFVVPAARLAVAVTTQEEVAPIERQTREVPLPAEMLDVTVAFVHGGLAVRAALDIHVIVVLRMKSVDRFPQLPLVVASEFAHASLHLLRRWFVPRVRPVAVVRERRWSRHFRAVKEAHRSGRSLALCVLETLHRVAVTQDRVLRAKVHNELLPQR